MKPIETSTILSVSTMSGLGVFVSYFITGFFGFWFSLFIGLVFSSLVTMYLYYLNLQEDKQICESVTSVKKEKK